MDGQQQVATAAATADSDEIASTAAMIADGIDTAIAAVPYKAAALAAERDGPKCHRPHPKQQPALAAHDRVFAKLKALLKRTVSSPTDPALDRELLRRAFQLAALLNAIAILQSFAPPPLGDLSSPGKPTGVTEKGALSTLQLLSTHVHLFSKAPSPSDPSPMPPAPLLVAQAGHRVTGDRVRLLALLGRFHEIWASHGMGLARDVAAAALHDLESMQALGRTIDTQCTGSGGEAPLDHPKLSTPTTPQHAGSRTPHRKPSTDKTAATAATSIPADDLVLIDMVAEHNHQLDDQRYEMTEQQENEVELAGLFTAIERSGQRRLENQRSPSREELRERRQSVVEAIVERQQHTSLDNQRFELTPEKLAAMSASELVHYVEEMNRMRYEDQAARSPMSRRRAMFDVVADVVERLQKNSLDDQRFIDAMADRLELSADSLRDAVSNQAVVV